MNTSPNRTHPPLEVSEFLLRERSFWQSRSMLRDPPQLVSLEHLAVIIRRTWHRNPWWNAQLTGSSAEIVRKMEEEPFDAL